MKSSRKRVGSYELYEQTLTVDSYTDWEGETSPKLRLYIVGGGQIEINCWANLGDLGKFLIECEKRMYLEIGAPVESWKDCYTSPMASTFYAKYSVDENGNRVEKKKKVKKVKNEK